MSQFGWGPFLGLNARGPFSSMLTNDVISFEQVDPGVIVEIEKHCFIACFIAR